MSTPGYSPQIPFTPRDVVLKLREFIDKSDHEFWPDDISVIGGIYLHWIVFTLVNKLRLSVCWHLRQNITGVS